MSYEAVTDNRETSAQPAVPLSAALVGQTVTFVGVEADEGIGRRLDEMGLRPGMRLEIVGRGPGPFVISVRGSRLALAQTMVAHIQVRTVME